jgi:hypothetical protein
MPGPGDKSRPTPYPRPPSSRSFEEDTPVQEITVYDPSTKRATVSDIQRVESALSAHSELDKVKLDAITRTVNNVESGQEALRGNVDATRTGLASVNSTLSDVRVELASWRPVIAKSQAIDQADAVETKKGEIKERADKRKKWRDLGFKVLGVILVGITGYVLAHLGL